MGRRVCIESRLSNRIQMGDILEIVHTAKESPDVKNKLYNLAFNKNDSIATNALWIMTHLGDSENEWLQIKQEELINRVLIVKNDSQRRLILTLLYKLPISDSIRVDFLDFCLNSMNSTKEPHGIRYLAMKLAYEMCKTIPELAQEYCIALDFLEPSLLPPSLRVARKNILNAMKKDE